MEQGTITRWVGLRGFGFAKRQEGQRDAFLHISEFEDEMASPRKGDRIEFEVVEQHRGPRAVYVRVVDD
jgi:cold shock protein